MASQMGAGAADRRQSSARYSRTFPFWRARTSALDRRACCAARLAAGLRRPHGAERTVRSAGAARL